VAAPERREPVESRPITGVVLPRIGLAADVVPAELVEQDDTVTWLVPAFKAGHSQYTAGPGEPGNGVVFGHVTNRSLGNVFEPLHRAHVGDPVEIYGGEERFDYLVVAVLAGPRTDVSVLAPTESASVTLITCTGDWNIALHDYMSRFIAHVSEAQRRLAESQRRVYIPRPGTLPLTRNIGKCLQKARKPMRQVAIGSSDN